MSFFIKSHYIIIIVNWATVILVNTNIMISLSLFPPVAFITDFQQICFNLHNYSWIKIPKLSKQDDKIHSLSLLYFILIGSWNWYNPTNCIWWNILYKMIATLNIENGDFWHFTHSAVLLIQQWRYMFSMIFPW